MRKITTIVTILLVLAPFFSGAQSYLNKGINVKAKQKPLSEVLTIISKQGGFFFSYNSHIVPADSLIDIDVWNKTVRQTLDIIFKGRFEYKETPNHVIIQQQAASQYWYVSGYVVDETTGERVRDVSVFDSDQLVASLTNDQGYFKLRLKDKTPSTTINIRKSLYRDTLINIMPGVDQEVKVNLSPKAVELDAVVISSKDGVEGTWFGKAFLSSRQRMQSLNMSKFFVDVPVQGSIVPGLSSQGKMSTQTVNNFSINMIGGYTAGVNGAELGGIFNINKKDVKYVQVAGIVNIVGDDVVGLQAAGIHNNVMDSMTGGQYGGVSNVVRGAMTGIQAAGIYNLIIGRAKGAQFSGVVNMGIDTFIGIQGAGVINSNIKQVTGAQYAGVANFVAHNVKGVQVAGALNFCAGKVDGVQISGAVNYATKLKGVQIGVFNYADSSSGVAIGLFSFVRKGYHNVSISANEVMPYNVTLRTGTHWLYNVYTAGASNVSGDNAFNLGMGYGSELPIAKRVSINPELTGGVVYLGNWSEVNPLIKLQTTVNVHLTKWLAVYAGPSYTAYWDNLQPKVEGYKAHILPSAYKRSVYNANLSSWIGWTAGITFF